MKQWIFGTKFPSDLKVVQSLEEAVKQGIRIAAVKCTQEAMSIDTPPQEILDALVRGMDDVGRRFKINEIFVPEMLIAARAMKESIAILEPVLVEAGIKPEFTALIGTVQGDLHDIGKNLVGMMWKGANFQVIDLGSNVPPAKFAEAVLAHKPDVVGLSALLTTTMPLMKDTVEAIREKVGDTVKIVIGGAPVTQDYADEIGADGYATDAASAVDLVRDLIGAQTG